VGARGWIGLGAGFALDWAVNWHDLGAFLLCFLFWVFLMEMWLYLDKIDI
jgi:hypothetical protein